MVESLELPPGTVRLPDSTLRSFLSAAFQATGVPEGDAELVADVLVSADLRGIRSHGVARTSYFLLRLQAGVIDPRPSMELRQGTPTTALLEGGRGIGIVAAGRAMDEAVAMARRHGSGFVVVRDSSHFGYAGYWTGRAMAQGMVGVAMSNSGRRVAPTFGIESVLGTNPISVTMPGGHGTDFFLDMATSAVAVGKVETALREGREPHPGWVSSAGGRPRLDENGVLTYDAPLLPLGGEGDETGGHKGYGLSLMVELLCGALGGSSLSDRIAGASGEAPPAMGHFLGAIDVGGFEDPEVVQAEMQKTFDLLRGSAKAPGHDRILIHGEPEAMAAEVGSRLGLPVTPPVLEQLRRWNDRLALGFDLP